MDIRKSKALVWVMFLVFAGGCATTGSHNQMEDTVYSTYRIVKNLDSNLGQSVTKLNETAADLGVRVDASEKEVAKLQALAEENQRKLDQMQSKLDKVTNALYKQWNLSTSEGAPAPVPPAGDNEANVQLEPPVQVPRPEAGTSAPATQETAPPVSQLPAAESNPTSGDNPVEAYTSAQDSFKQGKYEEAIRKYKDFLERYPDNKACHNAQFRVADCYARLKNYEKAVAEYDQFRTKYSNSPFMPTALHNEAAAYLRLNQRSRAIDLLKDLVSNYPTSPVAERDRGMLRQLESGN